MNRFLTLGLILILSSSTQVLAQTASSGPPGQRPGFEAFKKNVYPLIRQQCIQCHDNQGPGPNHSSSDPWISYQKVLSYTNFGNLKYSKFVTKGTNGHGNTYGGKVNLTQEDLIAVLQKWWNEGENTSFLADKKVLKAQNLPKLPDDGSFVTMEFNLGDADNTLAGVKLSVDVQRFMKAEGMHQGAYRLKNPRVIGLQGKYIDIQGIHIVVNGVPDLLANNFSQIQVVAGENESLSPSQTIVLEKKSEAQDQLTLAIDKVALTAQAPTPKQTTQLAQRTQSPKATRAATIAAFDESKVDKAAHFVRIDAPVEFDMGSPESQQGRSSDERLHRVRLTKPFEIQATPVTQLQWYLVMRGVKIDGQDAAAFPSRFREEAFCDKDNYIRMPEDMPLCKNHPVEQVSWNDIQIFIKRLNEAQTEYTYRLPTEAEYEYVAHAGLPPEYAYGFGNDFDGNFAWFFGNSNNRTHAVGLKEPTPSPSNPEDMIYDIHGNVWEWVQDWYGDYPSQPLTVDPVGPSTGSYRVLRGGGWDYGARVLRSASRDSGSPGYRSYDVGFRLVRTAR